jgi:hypothetical protein
VKHAATFTGLLFTQNIQRVLTGITGVHDNRLVKLTTDADVMTERILLQLNQRLFFLLEIVQPGLTLRDDARTSSLSAQLFEVISALNIQRMNAAGEGHFWTIANQLCHRAVTGQRTGYCQHKFHVAFAGFCQHIVNAAVQFFVVQAVKMAV